jgi:hypothetical protein
LFKFVTILLAGFALSVLLGNFHIVLENGSSAIAYAIFSLAFAHILHAVILKD